MIYDNIAQAYDELHGAEQQKKIHYVKPLLQHKKLLDIGAGTGLLSDCIEADIIGIEPSRNMIKQSEDRPITMIHGDATTIKTLPSNTYTACVSFTAMHHVANPHIIYKHVRRVCVEDAPIIMSFLDTTPTQTVELFKQRFKITDKKRIQRDTVYVASNKYLKQRTNLT